MKHPYVVGVLMGGLVFLAAWVGWRRASAAQTGGDAAATATPVAPPPTPTPAPRVACEADAGLSEVEALFNVQVDTPRGTPLRSGPTERCGVILSLQDETTLEVVDDTSRDAGWLRVRAPEAEGWVDGHEVALGKGEIRTERGLMLRSRTISSGMQDTTIFTVFLERDGGWEPYEAVTGGPFSAPTDFEANAEMVDLDEDGDTDLVFSQYCCGRGSVTVLCSMDGGVLEQVARYEGSEFEEDTELELPRLAEGGTVVTMGNVQVALSCTRERDNASCPEGMKFVRGGHFKRSGEGVLVSGLCMDTTEVTVAAYTRKATAESPATGCNWNKADRRDDPVNCVTSTNASAYCEAIGKRLPTDDEWELAVRDLKLVNPRVCWNGEGNDLGKGKRTKTCRAGSFDADATPAGIRDLAGNVAEWTSTTSEGRIITRGGTWAEDTAQPAQRRLENDGDSYPDLGFRCVSRPAEEE